MLFWWQDRLLHHWFLRLSSLLRDKRIRHSIESFQVVKRLLLGYEILKICQRIQRLFNMIWFLIWILELLQYIIRFLTLSRWNLYIFKICEFRERIQSLIDIIKRILLCLKLIQHIIWRLLYTFGALINGFVAHLLHGVVKLDGAGDTLGEQVLAGVDVVLQLLQEWLDVGWTHWVLRHQIAWEDILILVVVLFHDLKFKYDRYNNI